MTMKETTARSLALSSLIALERDGRFSNLEVDSSIRKSSLSDADRNLYTRLVYGVTERRITLDHIIAKYSDKPVASLDSDVLNALRLGIYQLVYMDRIPEHAAVGETAGLVQRSKTGYVNAVLRSFLRAGRRFDLPDRQNVLKYLSVRYSMPEDLCSMFRDAYGEDGIEELLDALNTERPVGLRVNTLKTGTDSVLERTGGRLSSLAPDIVLVDSLDADVRRGIDEGLWFVQDEASRMASVFLGARPGETVIDTCACPGGKSFSVAMDMNNEGGLYSFDLHRNKLSLIEKGAEKLGITIIKTGENDARTPKKELAGKADRVLCDAPCSGYGTISKKPDIRYKDIALSERLPDIQTEILSGAAEYVRDGGVLVYSTCTLNPRENEGVLNGFLENHSEFTLEKSRTFLPHKDGCDGFFAAKMRKK